MSNYDKLTVVEIRAEFKSRGLAATGLTRKQALIDRLLEVDAANAREEEAEEVAPVVEPAAVESGRSAADVAKEKIKAREVVEEVKASDVPGTVEEQNGEAKGITSDAAVVAAIDEVPVAATQDKDVVEPSSETITSPFVEGIVQEPSHIGPTEVALPPATQNPVATEHQADVAEPVPSRDPSVTVLAEPEDSRKRKRRSASVDPREEEVQKRRRPSEEPILEAVEEISAESQEPSNDKIDATTAKIKSQPDVEAAPAKEAGPSPVQQQASKDARYKSLFSPPPISSIDGTSDIKPEDTTSRTISPSLHPATSALYIRNLKRPLQPASLKSHLETLSLPPTTTSQDVDTSSIKLFHIDTLRTHSLVLFTTPAAAARVRAALHDSVYPNPNERTREPLWVDFVPDEEIQSWIDMEVNSSGNGGRGGGVKRWEVVYDFENTEDGERVVPRLVEVGAGGGGASGTARNGNAPPTGPRASFAQHAPPPAPAPRITTPEVVYEVEAPGKKTDAPSAPFMALDTLFKSTAAKPKLYFLSVTSEVANARLDELDSKSSRRLAAGEGGLSGGNADADKRRYTFEDGTLVDGGPEFGLRGPGGEASFRGGGGGYRGRGGGRVGGRGGWRGR